MLTDNLQHQLWFVGSRKCDISSRRRGAKGEPCSVQVSAVLHLPHHHCCPKIITISVTFMGLLFCLCKKGCQLPNVRKMRTQWVGVRTTHHQCLLSDAQQDSQPRQHPPLVQNFDSCLSLNHSNVLSAHDLYRVSQSVSQWLIKVLLHCPTLASNSFLFHITGTAS